VRQAGPPVVDDIHVHELAVADHGDRDGGRVRGVLHGVRDKLAGEQLGVRRAWMAGQAFPDEAARGRDFLRLPGERAGLRGLGRRTADPLRTNSCDGRSGHVGLRIMRDY
jgi:hypothetical protein